MANFDHKHYAAIAQAMQECFDEASTVDEEFALSRCVYRLKLMLEADSVYFDGDRFVKECCNRKGA